MPSTILVVALSLGLCYLVSIMILLRFVYRQDSQNRYLQDKARLARKELYEVQKQLDSFPKGWKPHECTSGFTEDEVKEAFVALTLRISEYVMKWTIFQMPSHPFNDSLSRIEDILFPPPDDPKSISPLNADKDIRIFRNPHNYTTAEIKAYLETDGEIDPWRRRDIVQHTMTSILLTSVSLDGDRTKSLLPFSPSEVCGLDRLFTTTRHVELFEVESFISLIGTYFARSGDKASQREMYGRLFDNLFEPYYIPQPNPSSFCSRHVDINKVLDATVNYGMKVLGHGAIVETRWGSRPDGGIMCYPAMYCSHFFGQTLDYCDKVVSDSTENAA